VGEAARPEPEPEASTTLSYGLRGYRNIKLCRPAQRPAAALMRARALRDSQARSLHVYWFTPQCSQTEVARGSDHSSSTSPEIYPRTILNLGSRGRPRRAPCRRSMTNGVDAAS
jgi:hypothetical protein